MNRYEFEETETPNGQQLVTIKDASEGQVIWTKTRELVDDEIVSTIRDSHNRTRWTVRRPTRGWYLILQREGSAGRDEEPYIELTPARSGKTNSTALKLEFEFRSSASTVQVARPRSPSVRLDIDTDVHHSPVSLAMSHSSSAAPAASSATPLNDLHGSPTAHRRTLSSLSSAARTTPAPPDTGSGSMCYRLRPSFPTEHRAQSRPSVLERLKRWVLDPPRTFCCVSSSKFPGSASDDVVMAFEEVQSGFFRTHLVGDLMLSSDLVDASGFEPSFWAALACAYVDVLEERDGYEAAQNGD